MVQQILPKPEFILKKQVDFRDTSVKNVGESASVGGNESEVSP